MMRCKQMLSVLALVAPFAVALVAVSPGASEAVASELYPNLCESTQGVCVIGPMSEAVVLRTNVCSDGEVTTLMGAAGCTSGKAFYLAYGFVIDPITNTVLPQSPVINTCDAGYCVIDTIAQGTVLKDGIACCNPTTGDCVAPASNGLCSVGDVTWCEKIEENGDGTITCHE